MPLGMFGVTEPCSKILTFFEYLEFLDFRIARFYMFFHSGFLLWRFWQFLGYSGTMFQDFTPPLPGCTGFAFGHQILMFFSTSLFRPSEAPFCAKRAPKGPQIKLKRPLNPLNSQPLDPSKHMVFIDRITLWPVSGELWEHFFLKAIFRTPLFQFFWDFGVPGC